MRDIHVSTPYEFLVLPNDFVFVKQEPVYSGIQVSPVWGLDLEMRKRLILQEA